MPRSVPQTSELVVNEREDRRVIVNLPGRYSFDDGEIIDGERRQFACRAINISMRGMVVIAPVSAKARVLVRANIDRLGRLMGVITKGFPGGFVMSIEASDEQRERLAIKIDWIEMNKNLEVRDDRSHARFIPRRPHGLLMLADGSLAPCFVIDMSVSGTAVSADIRPEIGTVLAIGAVPDRVVRYLPGGFAIKFAAEQDRREVERLVIRKKS
jgi:hypothetical protein